MGKHFSSGRRGKRHYQKRGNYVRRNERIRVSEVRLIGPDGKQIGVMPTSQAMKIARGHGLDLVEISPGVRPPVCRVIDYGKYKYDQAKKGKQSKASPSSKIKEVKLRVRIDPHDYGIKMRRAEEFLFKGNKVRVTLTFRGRELEHEELGYELVNRAVAELGHVGVKDADARRFGRNISLTLSPLPEKKRRLKYNEPHEVEPEIKPEPEAEKETGD